MGAQVCRAVPGGSGAQGRVDLGGARQDAAGLRGQGEEAQGSRVSCGREALHSAYRAGSWASGAYGEDALRPWHARMPRQRAWRLQLNHAVVWLSWADLAC